MIMSCGHKYIHVRNESYYWKSGRYSYEYVCVDYFFCEKCLDEKIKKKTFNVSDTMLHTLPDWARAITNKVHNYE